MSDKKQPQGGGATAPDGDARSGWFVALPAITLVIGLVLGGLIAWAAVDGPPTGEEPSSGPTAADSESVSPEDEPSPTGDVEVVVPQECLDAAATVEEATEVLRNGVGAVEDFDRQSILDMLNRLEDLEAQAREQADRCSDVDVNRPQ